MAISRAAAPRCHQPLRRGFTLVELLVVIVILAMLAALVGRVTVAALRRGREAVVSTEISQIQNAMNEFKTKYGVVPPSLGGPVEDTAPGTFPSETTAQRQARIMRFVSRAFPRWVADPSAVSPYADWQIQMAQATLWNPNFASATGAAANTPVVTPLASKNCCDVATLDPAEMLVLWLGGIPRRRAGSGGAVLFELTGFSADASAPFRMAVTRQEWNAGHVSWQQKGLIDNQRAPSLFQFEISRLFDVDGDGWPEYVPTTSVAFRTPYAFFSSQDYPFRPAYPYFDDPSLSTASQPADDPATPVSETGAMLSRWGLAKPYASIVTTPATAYNSWQITWAQPDTFQIIAAGYDGIYGNRPTFTGDATPPAQPEQSADVRLFPDGLIVRVNGAAVVRSGYSEYEADNQTSFTSGRLESEITGKK